MHPRARTFFRSLRGAETTAELSKRLGYTSDVYADWETGRLHPTASEVFRVCAECRIDVMGALTRFEPGAVDAFGSGTDREIGHWMSTICGSPDPREAGSKLGRSKTMVRRWLSGRIRPPFGDLLALLDAYGGRGDDLLDALLPPPEPLPADPTPTPLADRSAAAQRGRESRERVERALEEARSLRGPPSPRDTPEPVELAEEDADEVTVEIFGAEPPPPPKSEAELTGLMRALASEDYATLGADRPGWLAARLQRDPAEVQRDLARLQAEGRIRFEEDRWRLAEDTDLEPVGREEEELDPIRRLARRRGSQVVASMSREDLERVRQLQQRTRGELSAISESTTRKEILALFRTRR